MLVMDDCSRVELEPLNLSGHFILKLLEKVIVSERETLGCPQLGILFFLVFFRYRLNFLPDVGRQYRLDVVSIALFLR